MRAGVSVASHGLAVGVGILVGGWWGAPAVDATPAAAVITPRPNPPVARTVDEDGVDATPTPPDCAEEVATAEKWCESQVWAAGGALPVAWPAEVDQGWRRREVEAWFDEALARCEALQDQRAELDCDEYPCVLFTTADASAVKKCGAPQWPWTRSMPVNGAVVSALYFYPAYARDKEKELFGRREQTRWNEITSTGDFATGP